MIGVRRWMAARSLRLGGAALAAIGVPVGFLTGLVASTGPITAPIFLAAGLVKGAFLSSEAMASLFVYAGKAAVFRTFGALPLEIVAKGLIIGASLMVGAFVAKRFVLAMDAARFGLLMDGLMLASGATLLWVAFFG
jgi:uncharacterized membrane protein YfcA